jgi:signal transduction histidine kinase
MSLGIFHDFKNPICTALLAINQAQQTDDTANKQDSLDRAHRAISHMQELLNLTMGQQKIDAAKKHFCLYTKTVSVLPLIEHKARIQSVMICIDKSTGVLVYGIPQYWDQIMLNLIENAIDAYDGYITPKRTVTISAKQTNTHTIIYITDHGIGICEPDRIYNIFYTTKKEGTGIGLAIVKHLIEQEFGGEVSIKSTDGATVCTISIPRNL